MGKSDINFFGTCAWQEILRVPAFGRRLQPRGETLLEGMLG